MRFSQRSRTYKLSPGEELLLKGNCALIVQLSMGVVYLAGRALEVNQSYSFSLRLDAFPSLSFYSLEGGTLLVKVIRDRGTFEAHRGVTGMGEVHRLVYRDLIHHPTGPLRVVVLGRPGIGKSYIAASLCHLLQHAHAEIGASRRMFLADLNPTSNQLFAPGCMSSRELLPDSAPMWIGQMANPTQPSPTLSFYCGTTLRPSNLQEGAAFLHFAEQCVESTVGWVEEQLMASTKDCSSSLEGWYGLVVDVPSPSGTLLAVPFYKQLLHVLRPTHVVIVSDEVPPGIGDFEDDALNESEEDKVAEEDEDQDEEEKEEGTDEEIRRERREEKHEARRQAKLKKERGERGGVSTFYLSDPSCVSFPLRWIPSFIEDVQNLMPDCQLVRVRPVLRDTRAMMSIWESGRSSFNGNIYTQVNSTTYPEGDGASTSSSSDRSKSRNTSQTSNFTLGKDYLRRGITDRLLQQYFVGGKPYPLLGCSKVVLPFSAVQLVEVMYDPDISGVKARPLLRPPDGLFLSKLTTPNDSSDTSSSSLKCVGGGNAGGVSVKGLVCSLSHAEVLEEVPYAPTAGLLVILYIDEDTEEMALMIPAASSTPLAKKFIVLPSRILTAFSTSDANSFRNSVGNSLLQRDEGLCVSSRQLAWLEEFIVA